MTRSSTLAFALLVGCTSAELAEEGGRSAAARPLEDCPHGECAQSEDGGIAGVVDETVAQAATRTAVPGLPDNPSLRLHREEAKTVAQLRAELGAIPAGEALQVELLFRLANAYRLEGSDAQMKEAMLQLIRQHPTSEAIPSVYALFGEHYFDEGEYQTAGRLYAKIAQFPESRAAALALYMGAWCELLKDEPDYAKSLEAFVNAVARSRRGVRTPYDGFAPLALRDAALSDLVVPYYHAGQPAKFAAFFERMLDEGDDGDALLDAATSLAIAYEETGMAAQSDALCMGVQAVRPGEACP